MSDIYVFMEKLNIKKIINNDNIVLLYTLI